MPGQPIPHVNRTDVERIIRRDFPPEEFSAVQAILDEYGAEGSHKGRSRVHLAILRMAGGDLTKLRYHIDVANCDWRDVLGMAEYPEYYEKPFRIDELPVEELRRIIDADWRQY